MGTVNVNRSVVDPFYRYQMPRIFAKVEGKGNGIKTVLVNMTEISKALSRPATYITKYFGCELGAQTQVDIKNERFIVNGSHQSVKLQELLDGFIKKFVLCPECDNPETELIISTKRNIISQVCKACGYHGQLNVTHKLNTYILKNPPEPESTQGTSHSEGQRNKRSKRSGANSKSNGAKNSNHKCDNMEMQMLPQKTSPTYQTKQPLVGFENDETWNVDFSAEAVASRMQDLNNSVKMLVLLEDDEKNDKQRMDMFHAFIKQLISRNLIVGNDLEILQEAKRLDVKSKAPLILFELLIRPMFIATDLKTHRVLIQRFTQSDARAQRSALYALDAMCVEKTTLITKIPALLKLLYDKDIVEENSIIEWFEKPSRKYACREVSSEVRQKAEPFIKWLREADEASDSDVDIKIHENVVSKTNPISVQGEGAISINESDDIEIDIDSI